jgi:glycosyltransferase involved in cell wall biosynthesis
MQGVVSVIVPAYNVGPYIEECITSLLRQTVPLEIIIVNDGSTDDTSQKLRAVHRPSRHSVILIEQDNRGPSAARNVGLSRASGQFIGFCDADDWVEPDAYSALVAAMNQFDAELIIYNAQMVDHNTRATRPFQDERRLCELAGRYTTPFDSRSVPDVFMLDVSFCKRLFKRSLLQRTDFRFAEGLLFEDTLAHFQLLMASRKTILLPRKLYNARTNRPGRISQRTDSKMLTVFEILRLSAETLRTNQASEEIWANFISYQDWVLRWMARQINPAYQNDFLRGVALVRRQCEAEVDH